MTNIKRYFALAVFLIPMLARADREYYATQTITTSGSTVTFNNGTGSKSLTVEETINGSPSTVSIVINGCGEPNGGGVCEALDTYTTVANQNRSPNITKLFESFTITASWTGGTNVSVVLVPFASTAQGQGSSGGAVSSVAGKTGAVTLVVADVSGAAPLASPALTGSPTAPNQTALDNSTKVANTHYADAAVAVETSRATTAEGAAVSSSRMPGLTGDTQSSAGATATTTKQLHETITSVNAAASPYTPLAADSMLRCDATGGAVNVPLPAATGTGRELQMKKVDSSGNTCTFTRSSSDTIDGATSVVLSTQYAESRLQDAASGLWDRLHQGQLGGDLAGIPSNATVSKLNGNTPGGTCTNGLVTGIDTSGRPSCATSPTVSGTMTAAKFTANPAGGVGAQFGGPEGTDPGGEATNVCVAYADSATHTLKNSCNNASQTRLVQADADVNASDQVIQLHESVTAVNNAASPYTVLSTDSKIRCDATAGNVTINLPAATGTKREIAYKKTDSTGNTCTFARAGSDLIDGQTSIVLNMQYESGRIQDSVSAVWDKIGVVAIPLSGGATGATVASATTNFATLNGLGAPTATESGRVLAFPWNGILQHVCLSQGAQTTAGVTYTVREWTNSSATGADTIITWTVASSSSAGTYCDDTHQIPITSTKGYDIKIVEATGAATGALFGISAVFIPTVF